MGAERRPQHADELIAALASRQDGVVSRTQLAALGVGRGAVERRIATGRLHAVPGHRAVFAVGHTARGPWTSLWAAHLTLGPGSVVSHRAAAWRLDLLPSPRRVELVVPGSGRRPRGAVVVHRTRWLPGGHVTTRDGLPITTVARTLFDLGAVARPRQVEVAFDRAELLGLLDMGAVDRLLREGSGHPGAAALRTIAGRQVGGSTLTDSELGEMLLAIVRRAGLPEPRQQMPLLGYRVDFCWPEARLVVEADGAQAHARARAHAHDSRRDVLLTNAGWTVLRFAYAHIAGDPRYVADAIATALARGRRSASM